MGMTRTMASKKSVLIGIGNINNCQALHGTQFQSPREIWPLAVFYHGDSRENLELNIGDGNRGPGWLNTWVENVQVNVAARFSLQETPSLKIRYAGRIWEH